MGGILVPNAKIHKCNKIFVENYQIRGFVIYYDITASSRVYLKNMPIIS